MALSAYYQGLHGLSIGMVGVLAEDLLGGFEA